MVDIVFVDTSLSISHSAFGNTSRIGTEEGGALLVAAACEELGWKVRYVRPQSDDADAYVREIRADTHGVLVFFPYTYRAAFAEQIARRFKGVVPIIFAGYDAGIGAAAKRAVARDAADYVIQGRGDTSLPWLLDMLDKGLVSFPPRMDQTISTCAGASRISLASRIVTHHERQSGEYALDRLPWMKRDDRLIQRVRDIPLPFMPPRTLGPVPERCVIIAGSLGCDARCDFCSSWMISSRALRRSPKNIVDEMAALREHLGATAYMFVDPLFNADRQWVIDLCSEMARRGPFPSVAMPDFRLDLEMVTAMKRAGFFMVMMGIEVPTDRERLAMGKRAGDVVRAFELCSEVGIITRALCMTARLGMSRDDFVHEGAAYEALFAGDVQPDHWRFSFEVPFPGTPLAETIKPTDIAEEDRSRWYLEHPVLRTGMSAEVWHALRHRRIEHLHRRKKQRLHYDRQMRRFPELRDSYESFFAGHLTPFLAASAH